jgi:hypothetical protein
VVGGAWTQPISGSAKSKAATWLWFNLVPGCVWRQIP